MSKEPNNLRLLGSPVNLSYRGKKKDDKKNIRNRPRSALQNCCYPSENHDRLRRPFSAGSKEPLTKNLLKSISIEALHSYNSTPNNIRVVPPTIDLLKNNGANVKKNINIDTELCSNTSEHGSEDTYISLGTKIKAKAQSPKAKHSNYKNFVKYRNLIKRERKVEQSCDDRTNVDVHTLDITLPVRTRHNSPVQDREIYQRSEMYGERSPSPYFKRAQNYFLPMNDKKTNRDSLAGRVSFGSGNLHDEVEEAIDTYSKRLNLTKQQLSLVEEECTQDLDSAPSNNLSSLSPENSIEEAIQDLPLENETELKTFDFQTETKNTSNNGRIRTYTSFYEDFEANNTRSNKHKESSKDSGYTDSGTNDEHPSKHDYSLQSSSLDYKRNGMQDKVQPKSMESIPSSVSYEINPLNTFPPDKKVCQWTEPLKHSRLLYKDFFIKKEVRSPTPYNSPRDKDSELPHTKVDKLEVPSSSNHNKEDDDAEYPEYLRNSNTKAYTSKVIEDYKKELEAINNLHELTIKDIKTDAKPPSPVDVDKMFEPISRSDSKENTKINAPEQELRVKDKNDVSKISTNELIQNYLRVKKSDYSKDLAINLKRFDKKMEEISSQKQVWNNKSGKNNINKSINVNKSPNNKIPLSARIEGVENDKDVESWVSLLADTPRVVEVDNTKESPLPNVPPIAEVKSEETTPVMKPRELSSNATVLDICTMLKEIESFGEKPVNVAKPETPKTNAEEEKDTPKDNFMEIFKFLEKVEESTNDALSLVTSATPSTIPSLESLLRLPVTELAQRLVTASLQLEERSCCIALLQESLATHKEQMINKISNLERQSQRQVSRVKSECEDAIKRHQAFIDQLINDKKTLNHRIEQLVDERRAMEEKWRRSAQAMEERYKLELSSQRDKMAAAQQVARQRWVKQKAEKIKELTVKGLEGELRDMAERQQKEIADLKMGHAEYTGRMQAKHASEIEELRRKLNEEKEEALVRERQMASHSLEKQILALESSYQSQRTRLVSDMRAENERVAKELLMKAEAQTKEFQKWKAEQEQVFEKKQAQIEETIQQEKQRLEVEMQKKEEDLIEKFEQYKREYKAEQEEMMKRREEEIIAQHKRERDKESREMNERIEREVQAARRELQESFRRNKEQYECELKELAETEQNTLRRYQEAQARVRSTEDRCAQLEVEINQLLTRNKVLTDKNIQLDQRTEEIRASVEKTWSDRLETVKKEVEDMKKMHEEQMHQLYAKVKVAVARKDSAIQALNRDNAKYKENITLLEQKLQQQRKDFLKQK